MTAACTGRCGRPGGGLRQRQQQQRVRRATRRRRPGITATSVTIGSTQPLTGPAAPGYSEIAPAANAYFQYVNAHGGVFGRSINFKFLDDGYNPTNTASLTRQLVLQDSVYAMFDALGTPTHLAVVDYLNQQKVPDLFVASGCNCWNNVSAHPYTFGWQPDYTIEGKILGNYVKQTYPGKKVGYFAQGPNDEFGDDGVLGLNDVLQNSGVTVVSPVQYYAPTTAGAMGVKAEMAAMQAAGVAGRGQLLDPGVHRDRAGVGGEHRLPPGLRGQQRRRRPAHPHRHPHRRLARRHAAGGVAHRDDQRRVPAAGRRQRQPVDHAVQVDQGPVRAEPAVGRQRALRRGLRVHVRAGACAPPARTPPATTSATPWRTATSATGPGSPRSGSRRPTTSATPACRW